MTCRYVESRVFPGRAGLKKSDLVYKNSEPERLLRLGVVADLGVVVDLGVVADID